MKNRTSPARRPGKTTDLSLRFVPVVSAAQIRTVSRLARAIWVRHYVPIIGKAHVDYMLARFQSAAAISAQVKEGNEYYLMQTGRKPIGYFAALCRKPAQELFISKLYVLSSERGKGIGRRALTFIERLAASRRLRRLRLTVNKHNAGSIAFYLRNGFINSGAQVKDIGRGFVMDDYVMIKSISRKRCAPTGSIR